ncbi:MAG: hypothetical protein JRJ87_24445 [Deltaproteobacteria bacterium]|nr:hypothetical protein [Deltaproteobacteria bacterium]
MKSENLVGLRLPRAIMLAVLACGISLTAVAQEPKDTKVVVPGVHAYAGVPAGTDGVLCDLLLEALLSRHGINAMGPADVRALLTAKQQKELLGCNDESCMADLAGALGADWLIGGSVGKLEDLYVLSLQLIDAKKAKVTARAKAMIKGLKVAPQRIGPLVDELLGAQPRLRHSITSLSKPPAKKKEVMSVDEFRKVCGKYMKLAGSAPYNPKLVELRRTLLEDLVFTPYKTLFDRKRPYFWDAAARVFNAIKIQAYSADTQEQTGDAKKRLVDVGAFYDQIKILEEEYPRRLAMETNGTGRRLSELPFKVATAVVPVLDDTQQNRVYKKAYQEATKIMAKALKAAERNDEKAFFGFFTAKTDKNRNRAKPKSAFMRLRNELKNGYQLKICPLFIRPRKEVEVSAKIYQTRGYLEVCWRKTKQSFVSRNNVQMLKIDKSWLIDRW